MSIIELPQWWTDWTKDKIYCPLCSFDDDSPNHLAPMKFGTYYDNCQLCNSFLFREIDCELFGFEYSNNYVFHNNYVFRVDLYERTSVFSIYKIEGGLEDFTSIPLMEINSIKDIKLAKSLADEYLLFA